MGLTLLHVYSACLIYLNELSPSMHTALDIKFHITNKSAKYILVGYPTLILTPSNDLAVSDLLQSPASTASITAIFVAVGRAFRDLAILY